MKRIAAIVLAAVALALSATTLSAEEATVSHQIGVGYGSHTIDKDGSVQDIDADGVLIKYEGQLPFDVYDWVALNIRFNAKTEELQGMSIRYYRGDGSGTFPGLGVAIDRWRPEDISFLSQDTIVAGGEVLLEFDVPDTFPIFSAGQRALAYIGYETRLNGDHGVSQVDFGIDLLFDL